MTGSHGIGYRLQAVNLARIAFVIVSIPASWFGLWTFIAPFDVIAKTEMQVALNAVLDLLPNLRLDPARPAPRISGAQLRGPHEVHVVWD